MKKVFLKCGFSDVTSLVTLSNGLRLKRGDVLLNEGNHTAMFIGSGELVQASINEKGTTTGGQTGYQTGKEIWIRSYYNYPWNCVLRYNEGSSSNYDYIYYTVKSGDTLIGIAAKFGVTVTQLQQWNGISDPNRIYVGQVFKIYI